MRGPLVTTDGYRSPPPSRSVTPITQRSRRVRPPGGWCIVETMPPVTDKLTAAVEAYFANLRQIQNSGGATPELSFRTPLENLLNAVGAALKPKVFCVGELADQGAGLGEYVRRTLSHRSTIVGPRDVAGLPAPTPTSCPGTSSLLVAIKTGAEWLIPTPVDLVPGKRRSGRKPCRRGGNLVTSGRSRLRLNHWATDLGRQSWNT